MKRVLMTNFFFAKYTGSELHVLEVARLFEKRGYEVTIAVYHKAYPLLERAGTIRVVDVLKEELEHVDYDIIFVQHYPVLDYLCCKYDLTYKKLIVSKLSVISELETLPVCTSEADLILCVSDECAKEVYELIGENPKVRVFRNSVGQEFFEAYGKVKYDESPKKIAIISNHVAEELRELPQVMQGEYEIDYIGVEYTPKTVDAALLQNYGLVITIGRTVQQCFAAGVPVYVYDCFGVPGYIQEENFEEAESNNFSGRGKFGHKTALELREDIELNYEENVANLEKLNQIAREKYSLDLNFEKIYQELSSEEEWVMKRLNCYEGAEKQRIALYSKAVPRFALEENIVSQLYFDFGDGFSEGDSIRWNACEHYPITREIQLDKRVRQLRFDLCDVPSMCTIIEIYINGQLKEAYTNTERKFFGFDPRFFIDLSKEEQELDTLRVKLVYMFDKLRGDDMISDSFKKNAELQHQLSVCENRIKELEQTIVAIKEYYKITPKNIAKRALGIFKR